LATEIRAHRRTRSSYTSSSQSTPHGPAAPSPRPASQHARSPLGRFLPDGHDTIKSRSHHTHHAHRRHPSQPVTPNKSSASRYRVPRDSPFSDYFTDEARSVDQVIAPSAVQQVLARLNKLQSQLIRNATNESATGSQKIEDSAALALVERKLNEIASALNGMSCAPQPSRARHQLSDSGIELEAEEEAEEDNNSSHDGRSYHHITTSFDGSTASSLSNPTSPFNDSPYLTATLDILATSPDTTPLPPPQFSAAAAAAAMSNPQRLHTQMISLVRSVSVAQAELRRRAHSRTESSRPELEGHESSLDALRSENERLRADLELENCELLFLKLQMKAVELEAKSGRSSEKDLEGQAQNGDQILSSIEQWQEDWQDIEERFGRKNRRHGLDNALPNRPMLARFEVNEGAPVDPRRVPWRLETTKDEDGPGRVVSITMKRLLPIDEVPDGHAGREHDDTGVQDSSAELEDKHEETPAVIDAENLDHAKVPAPESNDANEPDAEGCLADHIDDATSLHSERQDDEPIEEDVERELISFAEQSTQTESESELVTLAEQSTQTDSKAMSYVEQSTQTDCRTISYTDQSTQTEVTDFPLPALSSSGLEDLDGLDTSSVEDDARFYEKSLSESTSRLERRKSAWNELWNGLSLFAGMEEDD
jgi:hypothetical protein